ncbi:MAG TPA: SAM-dependent methyltransferase, partial [Pyrinomonadaceae bacterium]|nr:SAM-dependent methyltransferase [Pyrinomonadaceae bacterium]
MSRGKSSREQEGADSLAERLRGRIAREGAITFAEWMRAALYDEREGYYRRRGVERWGRTGDYRTSPETSSLFGSTFARYFRGLFDELGRPPVFQIIEAGGGAGHFAAAALGTMRRDAPEVFDAVRYVF